MNAVLVLNIKSELGEGAIWNQSDQTLYWVDIEGKHFHIYDPSTGKNRTFNTGKRVGTVVSAGVDKVLLALEDGLVILNIRNGLIDYKLKTHIHRENNKRFNDGKCDPNGRFWVGTLSMDGIQNASSLYCVSNGFDIEEKITGLSISNGIAWNAKGDYMYHIDTPTKTIVKYKFDLNSGHISNSQIVVKIPEDMGVPDGMTIDCEDMLWVALWDGFCVARFNPSDGQLLEKINVPAPKVTSCAFGGKNYDTLFITTARAEMNEEELKLYPLSGSVFAAKVNAKGVQAHVFNM